MFPKTITMVNQVFTKQIRFPLTLKRQNRLGRVKLTITIAVAIKTMCLHINEQHSKMSSPAVGK